MPANGPGTGARLWTPLDGGVRGPAAWYDASNTASVQPVGGGSGTRCGAWFDLSGNQRTLSQATYANTPATGTAGYAGRNVLVFTGGHQVDAASNWTSTWTAGSAFIVCRQTTISNGHWQFGGGVDSWHTFSDGDAYEWFGTNSRKSWTPSSSFAQLHTYAVIAAASDWRAYSNGKLDFSTGTNTVSFGLTPKIGTGNAAYQGHIAELILFDHAVSEQTRTTIERYLSAKWGIPNALGACSPPLVFA